MMFPRLKTMACALVLLGTTGPARAEIIPATQLPPAGTWESAGVEGGIPERDTICGTVTEAPYSADDTGAASAVQAIQSAINDCPEGQVVYVPPGTYLIDDTIDLNKSVTLRGAGPATLFDTRSLAIHMGQLGPWPPPKAQGGAYGMTIVSGATRGSTTVTVADASSVEVDKMVMVDEEDDPSLVWNKSGSSLRSRGSLHLVESKTATTVTFRPPLPIDYLLSPRLVRYPDLVTGAGVEKIKFDGGGIPSPFIQAISAWNCWVHDCEFTGMPDKTIMLVLVGHFEVRRNYFHHQTNGGPNSEGIDLFADCNWSLVVDNACLESGFPAIVIGDSGPTANYSGGFGNVIAYNYAVDSFYSDTPHKMCNDISTNHSPHTQYNLVEGNVVGKFGSDAYHGSGSHTVLFRNLATGRNKWGFVTNRNAVSIDRRNLHYSLVGNVLGEVGSPADYEYAEISGWSGSALLRLGFPDIGNDGFSGTYPPTAIPFSDGGPRDLYCDRNNTTYGTTLIEGNWTSVANAQDWTIPPEDIPDSLYLGGKPEWFGNLAWPPVDPANPVSDDPTIIPAGYRIVHGEDPPPNDTPDGGPGPIDPDGGPDDPDASTPGPDNGSSADDGSEGCGCETVGGAGRSAAGLVLAGLALLLMGRGRRSRVG
jgi:hypothetical protein